MKNLTNDKIGALVAKFVTPIILLFFSLYFWAKGWTEPATTFFFIGTGLVLLGILLIPIQKVTRNNRRFVIVGAVLLFSIGLYCWIGRGHIYTGIFAILGGLIVMLREVLKERIWQIGVTAAFALAVGTIVYVEETSEDKRPTVDGEIGLQQKPADKASDPGDVQRGNASVSPEQRTVDMMSSLLSPDKLEDPAVQKTIEIMTSASFQEQMKAQNPQTLKEYFQIFAAHGLTEAAEIDVDKIQDKAYRFAVTAYKAKNPGKVPEDEDEVMTRELVTAIDEFGEMKGLMEFMKSPANVRWTTARFEGDKEAYYEWMARVRAQVKTEQASRAGPASKQRISQEDISSDLPTSDLSLAETSPSLPDSAQTEISGEYRTLDMDPRGSEPLVDPKKVVTKEAPTASALPTEEEFEVRMKEQFSPERFERAMSTLDRYGPEEGLRRLRESDPEVANQIENSRRAGVERHRNRRGEEGDSR